MQPRHREASSSRPLGPAFLKAVLPQTVLHGKPAHCWWICCNFRSDSSRPRLCPNPFPAGSFLSLPLYLFIICILKQIEKVTFSRSIGASVSFGFVTSDWFPQIAWTYWVLPKKNCHPVKPIAKKLARPPSPNSMLLHRFAWKSLQKTAVSVRMPACIGQRHWSRGHGGIRCGVTRRRRMAVLFWRTRYVWVCPIHINSLCAPMVWVIWGFFSRQSCCYYCRALAWVYIDQNPELNELLFTNFGERAAHRQTRRG